MTIDGSASASRRVASSTALASTASQKTSV
jgi:hypothetical protein